MSTLMKGLGITSKVKINNRIWLRPKTLIFSENFRTHLKTATNLWGMCSLDLAEKAGHPIYESRSQAAVSKFHLKFTSEDSLNFSRVHEKCWVKEKCLQKSAKKGSTSTSSTGSRMSSIPSMLSFLRASNLSRRSRTDLAKFVSKKSDTNWKEHVGPF